MKQQIGSGRSSVVSQSNPIDRELLEGLHAHLVLGSWLKEFHRRNSGKQTGFKACFGPDATFVTHYLESLSSFFSSMFMLYNTVAFFCAIIRDVHMSSQRSHSWSLSAKR